MLGAALMDDDVYPEGFHTEWSGERRNVWFAEKEADRKACLLEPVPDASRRYAPSLDGRGQDRIAIGHRDQDQGVFKLIETDAVGIRDLFKATRELRDVVFGADIDDGAGGGLHAKPIEFGRGCDAKLHGELRLADLAVAAEQGDLIGGNEVGDVPFARGCAGGSKR